MAPTFRQLWLHTGKTLGARMRRLCLALVLAMFVLPAGAGAQTPAHPTGDSNAVAGVMVDTGDSEPVYAVVAFDDTSVNAIDILRKADLQVVTVAFGGLGEGVCEIVETGCDPGSCRRRLCQTGDPESPFWQLWEQGDDGQWSASVLGGGQTTIADGDIVAWVWTGVEPELDTIAWSDFARQAGAPDGIVNGAPPDRSGVWTSPLPSSTDEDAPSVTNMLLSSSVLVLIAVVGMVLARRRRSPQAGAAR